MKKLLNFILIFIFFCNNSVFANNNISIIRDSEIENFLREILKPILISANLNPNDINYYVVDDDSINAFVMGGQNIFVNTGTLISFNTPDAILGILAHEVGHISVGHLSRFGNDTMGIQKMTIASILLGVGAMLVGVPEVGQTLIFGGAQVGTQSILKYTRAQENVADKLAVDYLHKNHLSANALLL
jgi:predicted Zn-dependent protease